MKLKKILSSALLGMAFVSVSSQAMAKSLEGSMKEELRMKPSMRRAEPWGMAGCGFASLFIKDKSQGMQIVASFVNWYSSAVTNSSAISSGSSNCVANRSELAMNYKQVFITVNLASLSKEAAQGTGDHINALADVFGCPRDEFAKMSQTHYKAIYGISEPDSVLQSYVKEVNVDQNLSKTCSKVI